MATLLVIEDELEVIDVLKDYFKHHGVEVLSAATGEEGLTLLEQKKPDLVLLDMKLGAGMSGMEVLRKARALHTKTQIVVVSAVDDENVSNMALGLGASGYVTKPLTLQTIEEVVLSRLKGV